MLARAYNALGEQVSKTNGSAGKPTCTQTQYDGQGRAVARNDYANASCSGTADAAASWTYDVNVPPGALASTASSDNASSVHGATELQMASYDQYGRPSSGATTVNGMQYVQILTYDAYGRPLQSLFAGQGIPESGEIVFYNAQGYAYQTRDAEYGTAGAIYDEVTDMDARDHVTGEGHANGNLATQRDYDPAMGWLTKINSAQTVQIAVNPATIQNLVYQYDALGNLMQRNDSSPGSNTAEYSCYDKLQRLTWQGNTGSGGALPTGCPQTGTNLTGLPNSRGGAAEGIATVDDSRLALFPLPMMANSAVPLPTGIGTQNQYDAFGNIKTNGSVGYIYGTYANSDCADNKHPNEVSTAGPDAVTQANGMTYCYDSHGNQTRAVDGSGNDLRTSVYSSFDALRSVSASGSSHTTIWAYGIGRERLVREDDDSAIPSAAAASMTHYIGNAEISLVNGQAVSVKRYVAGVILIQNITGGTTTDQIAYLFTDNLGSTHRVTDPTGVVPGSGGSEQAYTAFGSRASTSNGVFAAIADATNFDTSITHHGFTGHEMMDETGLIHMNGRVYDPALQRFVQADPFVQDAGNLQSLNRYSYVMNNPLATTDPTGYWGHRQQGYLRTVVAIAIAVASSGSASGVAGAAATAEEAAIDASQVTAIASSAEATEAAIVIAGGAAAGYVQSGNLKGAVLGGIESGADFGIGQSVPYANNAAGNVSLHALSGGVMSALQGGKFGHGFVTAGVGALMDPHYGNDAVVSAIKASIVGGTVSTLTGGKFANGAISAAFEFAFNAALEKFSSEYYALHDVREVSYTVQYPTVGNDIPSRNQSGIDPDGTPYADGNFSPDGGTRRINNRGHFGVDFISYIGDPVFSSIFGFVRISAPIPGFGHSVDVSEQEDGMGLNIFAGHLANLCVSKGQYVVPGQLIGFVGDSDRQFTSTMNSNAPHSHVETSFDGYLLRHGNVNPGTIFGSTRTAVVPWYLLPTGPMRQ